MNMDKSFRPWIWCIIWLLIAFSSLSLITYKYFSDAILPDCEKEYSLFSNQPPSSTNSPLVVALGDSLLQHAVPKTQWLNGNTRWYRVNIGAGQKEQFAPFLPVLEKVRPKLLLVQDSILFDRDDLTWFSKVKVTTRFFLSSIFPLQTIPCNKDTKAEARERKGEELQKLIKVYTEEHRNNLTLPKPSQEWLENLKNLADKVVVIHFPRSIAQANYNERIKWLDSIKKELYKLKIDFVSVGQPQDDSFYLDGAHANLKGQELMMNELSIIIESRL